MTSDYHSFTDQSHSKETEQEMPRRTRKLKKKKKSLGWSVQEYNDLIGLVKRYGEEWDTIAKLLPNKTPKQCMQKFKNS